MKLCDIHTHILPCVDDGARSFEYARRMLKNAYAGKIETLVATPHYIVYENREDNIRQNKNLVEHFQRFQSDSADVPVKLFMGAEVRVNNHLLNQLKQGVIPTINKSRYLLAEFSFDADLRYISNAIRGIVDQGFIPIVAHPERYISVCRNPMSVVDWLEDGAHLQLTGGSVMGEYGKTVKQTAEFLLKSDFVMCISSDAHGVNHRSNYMLDVCDHLSVYYSKAYAKCLMYDNPMKVCYDENLKN